MTNSQLASLEKKMQDWIEENCDDIDTYWGYRTAELMANAAASVVDGMIDLQEYFKKEQVHES